MIGWFKKSLAPFFFPHERNNYKPHIFRTASVTALIVGVLILEGAYLTQIKFVFPRTDFLASVLPGVLVALTNDDRTQNSLGTLTEDPLLDMAAQKAAEDMAAKGYFSHVSPDGKDPWYWLDLVGYQYQYAGQNLAVNFTESKDVEVAWMNSPTHHANIVKPQYSRIGIGVANGLYEGNDTTFVVQFFATPAGAAVPHQLLPTEPSTVGAATEPNSEPSVITQTPETVQVLGSTSEEDTSSEQVSPAAATVFAGMATSPRQTVEYILSTLAILVFLLLLIAFAVHARARYLEALGGGLLVLLISLGVLLFNEQSASSVFVGTDGGASVQTTK